MNLYDVHSDPESIHGHDKADMEVPRVFWDRYEHMPSELEKRKPAIAKDPLHAYMYAKDILRHRWPEGEKAIAKDPKYAYLYAYYVMDGRFPEGETEIAKNPRYAMNYAIHVIHTKFPKGEDAIATNVDYSYEYAYGLELPFPKGEPKIATNGEYSFLYAKWILHKRFPLGEKAIAKSLHYKTEYNKEFGTDL